MNNRREQHFTRTPLIIVAGLAGLLFIAGCSSDSGPPQQRAARAVGGFLSQADAAYRKRVVAAPAYDLTLELDHSEHGFAGEITLDFSYLGDGQPLTIDFKNGTVQSVLVNGAAVTWDYNGYFITLAAGSLSRGEQQVHIAYRHPYSQDGAGLYRYVDPEDASVYLYTDFEPYDANRLFPHFDQPDLKARYALSVSAPADWTVISSTRETAVSEINVEQGARRLWTFARSKLMSSYVFPLHAGQYAVFEDAEFRYPLRLFARQSMARYVDAQEWFLLTRQGFDYFDDYFSLPYPFGKYDQLLVPDYNAGAMENVAAVTFSEAWLSRGEATRRERMNLARTIMHEMAHMWFGNITTMSWWNGLWLNESFATYMAELALSNATGFKETWHEFFIATKSWAYREDQQVTTHPIELPVATTDDAFTNFDGITYGKGASVLKQLAALLGADTFRQGVRDYLAANVWGNTVLDDFIGALSAAADRDLTAWSQRWLYTAGLNTIQADYRCTDGRIASMQLRQTAPRDYPTLREQRTRVALYSLKDDVLQAERQLDLIFDGAGTEVSAAIGAPCPDFVYPNVDDWAYIKVVLDARSVATARSHINSLQDPLQRSMVWYDLYAMVLDAQLPLPDYLDILAANLAAENDLNTAHDLLRNLQRSFAYLHQLPAEERLPATTAARFEPLLWQQVTTSRGDARQLWLSAYIETANNTVAWQRLEDLLSGALKLDDVTLDQDQRWQIVARLNAFRRPGHVALVTAESARDRSALGREHAVAAQVLAARGEAQWHWLQQATADDDNFTLRRSRTIARGLFPGWRQQGLEAAFADRFLQALPALNEAHDVTFHSRVTAKLMPRLCTAASVRRLQKASVRYADLNAAIVRGLKIAAQEDERCVNIVALLGQHQK